MKIGERVVTIDLLTTKMAMEPVEEKHGAGKKDWRGTPAFLADLAAAIEGVGVTPCTPTAAYQIWCYVSEGWAELKKDMDAMRK